MTLIYKYQGKEQTIEEIVQSHPVIEKTWNDCAKEEYKFWGGIRISDLIVEISEAFEEEMALHDEELPIFIKNDSKPFDLNVLLNALR